MTQLWVEYSVAGGEIGPRRRPPLYYSHGHWPASASLVWLLMGMLLDGPILISQHFTLFKYLLVIVKKMM
jgi:hypothetical protein